ncbi:MAG TPA: hypothetical protein DDW45_09705 [Gammaproteobacteria bacterium]|nr:hypothetical protein [Gammaproteobacteria bacterium]
MKNITLSADEHLIDAARQRAAAEHTTLNEQFRGWLAEYARKQEQLRRFDNTVNELRGKLKVGRKLTRDEMNER